MQVFLNFVGNIITSEPSHQGYIHSCVHGIYNKDLLFFDIAGNYRYCPKKKGHHKRNTVAIMINTKNYTYCIRCKDIESGNGSEWKNRLCNCPSFFKEYICKHIIGMAIRLKLFKPPPSATNSNKSSLSTITVQ